VILTPDQRLRVFVSSALGELAPERAAVRAAVESMRLVPVMAELGARPHPPRALYQAYLEQSHVFLGIYGDSYGWVSPDMDVSGLEDEYRLSGDRPKLVYVREPAPDREPRLAALLTEIATDPRVRLSTFATTEELTVRVLDGLAELLGAALGPRRAAPGGTDELAGPTEAATPVPTPSRFGPLPVPPTTLVGRTRELDDVAALLVRPDVRMVTLTGMGGIGKSRLAIEAARRVQDAFPGGVVMVPLAELPESGLVLSSVASALGIRLDPSRPLDAVADALADRGDVLLLLDNAEQVEDAADDLAGLVATCPSVTLLVTSRKRMRLVAEHDYPLQPLSVSGTARVGFAPDDVVDFDADDVACDAVQLFLDRATAVRPDLDIVGDHDQLAAVIELCRRLEGLPLTIEIAAARVRLLPPTAILDRLHRRIDLPPARYADLPERQRTLRSTLQWSADLLTEAERDVLAQLSTFVGGASLAAVEQVCVVDGDVLESLAALADQSLLEVDVSVVDPPRFAMLETVREYARELLEETGRAEEVDGRHVAWVRDLAERAAVALSGSDHDEWVERLELEGANIRIAGSRAYAAGDAETLVDVGYHVWLWLWARHHIRETLLWLGRALELPDLSSRTRARLAWVVAGAAFEKGDHDVAHRELDVATRLFTELDDPEGRMLCTFLAASLAPLDGRLEDARLLYEESAERALALGDRFVASVCASTAGMIAAQLGMADAAEDGLKRGLALAGQVDNAMLRGQALVARGFARLGRGDVPAADADLRAGAAQAVLCRNPEILALAADGLAGAALAGGVVDERTVLLTGAATGLRERAGIVPWPLVRPLLASIEEAARAATGPSADELWSRGRRMSLEDVGDLAAQGAPAQVS
jgi:predicted ATPase